VISANRSVPTAWPPLCSAHVYQLPLTALLCSPDFLARSAQVPLRSRSINAKFQSRLRMSNSFARRTDNKVKHWWCLTLQISVTSIGKQTFIKPVNWRLQSAHQTADNMLKWPPATNTARSLLSLHDLPLCAPHCSFFFNCHSPLVWLVGRVGQFKSIKSIVFR